MFKKFLWAMFFLNLKLLCSAQVRDVTDLERSDKVARFRHLNWYAPQSHWFGASSDSQETCYQTTGKNLKAHNCKVSCCTIALLGAATALTLYFGFPSVLYPIVTGTHPDIVPSYYPITNMTTIAQNFTITPASIGNLTTSPSGDPYTHSKTKNLPHTSKASTSAQNSIPTQVPTSPAEVSSTQTRHHTTSSSYFSKRTRSYRPSSHYPSGTFDP